MAEKKRNILFKVLVVVDAAAVVPCVVVVKEATIHVDKGFPKFQSSIISPTTRCASGSQVFLVVAAMAVVAATLTDH